MPPKRKADAPYSPRGNANRHRQEYGSFKEALFENAWIGYWDEDWEEYWDAHWSFSPDSPFRRAFGEGFPSYDTLKTLRPGRVRTFESKQGRTPSAKTARFWKIKDKKTLGRRDDMTLVPVPFQENLWCWAYRFTEVVDRREEQLFALLSLEKTRSSLEGYWHEKYSYLLRHEEPGVTGYSEDNFLFVRTIPVPKKKGTGGDTPPGRSGEVHAQSLPGPSSNVPQAAHTGHASDDADLEEMVDELGSMPVQEPGCNFPVDAGTTSTTQECNTPRRSYNPRQRSETLRPENTLQNASALRDHSPTYPPVSSTEPTDAQEEESMSAGSLLDRFQRSNGELAKRARSQNGRINSSGERSIQNQKRSRENGDDSTYDTQMMPPPKQPKTTIFPSCGADASPRESIQCRPSKEGSSGNGHQRTAGNASTLPDRIATEALQASSPRIRSPKDRPLKRFTVSGDSSARSTKATQDQQASKEVSPARSSHQRQDSPMQRSPSEATGFYESGEQLRGEMQANVTPENAPLPIRSSPAVAPMTPSVSRQSGVGFDVNRALFKLVVADGKSREYGMRFHGCDTVQGLFEKVAERVEDELGPGDVLRNLIFYADMFVPERCRPEMDVPRDDEPSFSCVLSRIKKILEVVEDQVEIVVEVMVRRNN